MLSRIQRRVGLTPRNLIFIILGSMLIAFAMINVHDPSKITEGGVLGLSLFLKNVVGIPQTLSAPFLDILCFAFAISLLGSQFLKTSILATLSYSIFLKLFAFQGPILPSFYHQPWLAALIGGVLVGVGCCFVITQGGASGGDDALALAVSAKTGLRISSVFLLSDFTVLTLSLAYIPATRLIWSLMTTIISSLIIGQIEMGAKTPLNTAVLVKLPEA